MGADHACIFNKNKCLEPYPLKEGALYSREKATIPMKKVKDKGNKHNVSYEGDVCG